MQLSTNRVVLALTPFFAAAASFGLAWAAKNFPGLPLPTKGQLTAIEILGFTTVVGLAGGWLRGHQQLARDLADIEKILLSKEPTSANVVLARARLQAGPSGRPPFILEAQAASTVADAAPPVA